MAAVVVALQSARRVSALPYLVLAMLAAGETAAASDLLPGTVIEDCAGCPEMVVIPAGRFEVGPADDEEHDEGVPDDWKGVVPARRSVHIDYKFAVSKHPITRGQFRAFASADTTDRNGCVNFDGTKWKKEPQWSWRNTSFFQTDEHPVVCVSWTDAQAYVRWLSDATGNEYRLLTEVEWEYVARAGTSTRRYWGDDRDHSRQCEFANAADRTYLQTFPNDAAANPRCSDGHVHTSPVGSFPRNAFGLYDMLGNVTQWVEDCFRDENPTRAAGAKTMSPSACSMRVLRGGAWSDPPWGVRAADRYRDLPDTRCMGIGFRVARTLGR